VLITRANSVTATVQVIIIIIIINLFAIHKVLHVKHHITGIGRTPEEQVIIELVPTVQYYSDT